MTGIRATYREPGAEEHTDSTLSPLNHPEEYNDGWISIRTIGGGVESETILLGGVIPESDVRATPTLYAVSHH